MSRLPSTRRSPPSALYASYYGTNTSGYIAGVYGTGCNEKNFREYLEVVTLADSYATATQNGFTYTDEQIAVGIRR